VSVEQVCRRLDGIPLAIELAAARVRTLRLPELAARLEEHLDVLTAGRHGRIERHQTLRAALEWSWGLLDDERPPTTISGDWRGPRTERGGRRTASRRAGELRRGAPDVTCQANTDPKENPLRQVLVGMIGSSGQNAATKLTAVTTP
jgi:hypothetical protein